MEATRQKESSSSTTIVEVCPELSGEQNAYKENRNIDYDALFDEILDDDYVRYEDDNE